MSYYLSEMSSLVNGIGTKSFSQEFYEFCSNVLSIQHCTVFKFAKTGGPRCLVAEANDEDDRSLAKKLALEYTKGAYRNDPNLNSPQYASMTVENPFISCVNPSDILDYSYRQRFYDEAMIRQELALFVPSKESNLYFGFYRLDFDERFQKEITPKIRELSEFLTNICLKHDEVITLRDQEGYSSIRECRDTSVSKRQRMMEELRHALIEAPGKLTQREAEICASIALGYTTLGISLNLGISTNTVATHRKRAYSKLGISSQNELFSLYFNRFDV